MKKSKMKIVSRGFTYVELMMVVTIICILAAIAVPNFLEAQVRASVSRSKADLATIRIALDAYRLEHRAFPLNSVPGVADGADLLALTTPIAFLGHLPYDAFTLKQTRRQNRPNPMEPQYYKYFNGAQLDPEEGLRLYMMEGHRDEATTPVVYPRFGGYMVGLLRGLGPGESIPSELKIDCFEVGEGAEAWITIYDPSNGTNSRGGIFERFP